MSEKILDAKYTFTKNNAMTDNKVENLSNREVNLANKKTSSMRNTNSTTENITTENKKNDNIETEMETKIEEDCKDQEPQNIPNNSIDLSIDLCDLKSKSIEELSLLAEKLNIENADSTPRQGIIVAILKKIAATKGIITGSGVMEILSEGFGFLRSSSANYLTGMDDVYVSPNQIRRFGFRPGDIVKGEIRAPRKNERYFALYRVDNVNSYKHRVHFDDLTPLYPDSRLKLEIESNKQNNDLSTRIIDICCPLGRGQRALIVAPPRTGKTILMQNIAHSISVNYPEIELIVLLIDERPEEVTDMSRSVKGEVMSSTFDEPAIRHVQVAELTIEKAKRLVEQKKHVVILLDSITRLARAYNTVAPSSGKVLTGGVDSNALQRPKRFFGAARNIEQGGSLTIIATALVETGSRMDDVIFEEFKGTGNAEIILDRKLADKRMYPSIDIIRSGTRKEELLLNANILSKMWVLRRILMQMNSVEALEFLSEKMRNAKNNQDFFDMMNN